MKAIIYIRISSNEQVKGTSLKDQEQKQISMVAKHAYLYRLLTYQNSGFCNHENVAVLTTKKTAHNERSFLVTLRGLGWNQWVGELEEWAEFQKFASITAAI